MHIETSIAELRKFLTYPLSLFATAIAIFSWYLTRINWHDPEYVLSTMVAGTAYRPFVYRVLVPFLVGCLEKIHPLQPEMYAIGLMFLALLGFAITIRALGIFFWQSPRIAEAVSIFSIIALFPFLIRDGKIYDLPELFLFTLGLYLIARQEWKWFIVVYFLACVNKETTVLLSLVYAFVYLKKIRSWQYWKLLLIQAAIYLPIKLLLIWIFRNNPGAVVQFHPMGQIKSLLYFPGFVMLYGSLAACIAIFVCVDWRKKPQFLRLSALCLVPAVVLLYFLFSAPYEIRTLLDMYPVLILLSAPTLGRAFLVKFPEAAS